jgi:thiol-disulfide isomerase/thioredoxin
LILLLSLLLALGLSQGVSHLNNRNFKEKVNTHPFTLVYFYSSSCQFCQEFTPVFEKTARNPQVVGLNISLAKIDGPAYQNLTHSFEAFSYPTVALFWRGVDLPVIYRQDRKEKELVEWLVAITKPSYNPKVRDYFAKMSLADRVATKSALFHGRPDSREFAVFDVAAKRDGYVNWGLAEADSPRAELADSEVTDFSDLAQLERSLAKAYARLHEISEESWLKMADKSKSGAS